MRKSPHAKLHFGVATISISQASVTACGPMTKMQSKQGHMIFAHAYLLSSTAVNEMRFLHIQHSVQLFTQSLTFASCWQIFFCVSHLPKFSRLSRGSTKGTAWQAGGSCTAFQFRFKQANRFGSVLESLDQRKVRNAPVIFQVRPSTQPQI